MVSVLPSLPYTSSKRFRNRGNAPGLMGTCRPTVTSRSRRAPGMTLIFSFVGIFHPQQVVGQRGAEAMMDFSDQSAATGAPLRPPAVDPLLDVDMRFGFELQVAFLGVLAVVALEGALDLDRVGIMAFDQIAVVAVHRPHEVGERSEQASAGSAGNRRSSAPAPARDRLRPRGALRFR